MYPAAHFLSSQSHHHLGNARAMLPPAEHQAEELHHAAVLGLSGLLLETSQVFVQCLHSQGSCLPCHEPLGKKVSLQSGDMKTTGFLTLTPALCPGCSLCSPEAELIQRSKFKPQNYATDVDIHRKSSNSDRFLKNTIFRDEKPLLPLLSSDSSTLTLKLVFLFHLLLQKLFVAAAGTPRA